MRFFFLLLGMTGCTSTPKGPEAQFAECRYAYTTEDGLRQCLVMHYGWSVADAERRIGKHDARAAEILDSVKRAQQ